MRIAKRTAGVDPRRSLPRFAEFVAMMAMLMALSLLSLSHTSAATI